MADHTEQPEPERTLLALATAGKYYSMFWAAILVAASFVAMGFVIYFLFTQVL